MANIKDFAVGVVVTPPSPATSGNTAILRPAEAAEMPPVPFYAVATPPGQLTTRGTSEKILVTAVDTVTDTLTFTRAQTPTSAKSIAAGWIIANTIFADDVTSSQILLNQPVVGTPNGALLAFTTANPFSSIIVYKNGLRMTPGSGNDYTVTNPTTITFNTAPVTGTIITVDYIMGSSIMINGSNSWMNYEVPTGTKDGSNLVFTAGRAYIPGSMQVYRNGIREATTTHFTETSPTAGTVTLSDAPLSTDNIFFTYQFVLSVSGNADTLDGFHANATATAGQLFPLVAKTTDSNGWTCFDYGLWKEYSKRITFSQSVGASAVAGLTVSANNIPVAMATLGGASMIFAVNHTNGFGAEGAVSIETPTSNSALSFSIRNIAGVTRTYSGNIDVVFRI